LFANRTEVFEALFVRNGELFVCGSSSMARSVVERLKLILVDVGKMSDEQAEAYVKQMTVKRFVNLLQILSFELFYFFKIGVL
jgi:sulfite reductase alpha subunit-like flavoprotein